MSDFNVDWSKINPNMSNGEQVALGGDREFHAVFYMGKMPNHDLTKFEEVPHIRLQAPGSRLTVYDQPARLESFPNRPSDPERFPEAWAAFQSGQNSDGTGTPLSEWDGIAPNDVPRMILNGIHTVEQLAMVSDRHLDGIGLGGRALRAQAQAYVRGIASIDPEKAQLKDQVSKLTDIVGALMEKLGGSIDELLPPAPQGEAESKPRGRAKREPADAEA